MQRSKNIIKQIVPHFLIKFAKGLFYGWYGKYATWELANKKCTGYNASSILEKVKESTNLVKTGKAVFERDSYIFDKIVTQF